VEEKEIALPGLRFALTKKTAKAEQVNALLGKYTSVTRKAKLGTILRPEYHDQIKNNVVDMASTVREIMIRSQICKLLHPLPD
jgi:hypothetical protein